MITVIIPTYNMIKTIAKSIDSVQNQTYPVKTIVYDDGSTDGTADFLINSSYSNTDILIGTKNMGMSYAVNRALRKVVTSHFIVLASDDVIRKSTIKTWLDSDLADVNYCRAKNMIPTPPDNILKNIRNTINNGFAGVNHCHQIYTNDGRHIVDGLGALCMNTQMVQGEGYDENLRYKEGGELLIRLALLGYRFKYFDFISGDRLSIGKSLHKGNSDAIKYIKNKYRDFNIS